MTYNQAMLQTQLQQIMKDTKSIFGYVAPPKQQTSRKSNSNESKKPFFSKKKQHQKTQRPKPVIYKVRVPEPQGLNAAECAALRATAHIFDPDLTCEIKEDKANLLLQYLRDILTNYNTSELRASIPEHSNDLDDSDAEAEKDAINLEDTDDEDEEDNIDEKEFKDFIVDDDEEDEGDAEGDDAEGDETEGNEGDDVEEEENDIAVKQEEETATIKKDVDESSIVKKEEPIKKEIKVETKPRKTKSLFEWMQNSTSKKSKQS